tara:strand:- start:6 stop:374 length:369 start_codon:yes stop_codon:yes gene_type:complete
MIGEIRALSLTPLFMSQILNMVKHFDKLPPYLCRVLARKGRKALTNQDISNVSGLTVKRVGEISRLKSWGSVPLAQINAFAKACGVDLINQSNVRKYLKRGPKMAHVNKAKNKSYLIRLMGL